MSLNPTQTLNAIEIALEANIGLNMWGLSGIGKSAMVRQAFNRVVAKIERKEGYLYANEPTFRKGVENGTFTATLQDIRMAHMEISDWGIPEKLYEVAQDNGYVQIPIEAVGSREIVDTVHGYTRPGWWPRHDHEGLFVLFTDELNRGDTVAINGAMEIAAERSLRGRKAPRGLRLLGACNPASRGFQVAELDEAMRARWAHVQVETNAISYLENRIDYVGDISATLLADGSTVTERLMKPLTDGDIDDWSIVDQVEWCPRTWEIHNKLVTYMEWQELHNPGWVQKHVKEVRQIANGLIGQGNGDSWWSMYKNKKWISVEKLLSGEETFRSLAKASPSNIISMIFMLRKGVNDAAFFKPGTTVVEQARMTRLEKFFKSVNEKRQDQAVALLQYMTEKSQEKGCEKVVSTFVAKSKVLSSIREGIRNANDQEGNEL